MNLESNRLAKHFAGRVETVRNALTGLRLFQFADEICIILPRDPQSFERFVYWTEALAQMLERWGTLVEVRQVNSSESLTIAIDSANVLAKDARALWESYQQRLAR